MAMLALALHLTLASPGLVPQLDPGPFQGRELVAASAGVFAGDMLVLGAGYLTLQLFANGAFEPNAQNFRRAALGLGVTAVMVPPLVAVLLARWARADPASGSARKALLLAALGHVGAIAVGLAASPHFWVIVPVQLLAVAIGTTVGLHWGPRPHAVSRTGGDAPGEPPPAVSAVAAPALCPDPALASR